jgi:hypothetical protein
MREFTVYLTNDNKSGPFDIYYTSEGIGYLAPLVAGNYAVNITSASLGVGVNILADYGVSNISVVNNKETCNSIKELPQTPSINPFQCIRYVSTNNCIEPQTVQYTDCSGVTQTVTVNVGTPQYYYAIVNTPTVTSANPDCVVTTPDPSKCKYYKMSNSCSDIDISIKYIDCSGNIQTSIITALNAIRYYALENTTYINSGNNNCATSPEEEPDPNNPPGICSDLEASNSCSGKIIIKYTDCNGEVQTLDIPGKASKIPFSSLDGNYTCIDGPCECLVITKPALPSSPCSFGFNITPVSVYQYLIPKSNKLYIAYDPTPYGACNLVSNEYIICYSSKQTISVNDILYSDPELTIPYVVNELSYQSATETLSSTKYVISTNTNGVVSTVQLCSSTTGPSTFQISPSANNIDEGSPLTLTVTTTNVANSTLYWKINPISPTINDDFIASEGTVSIVSNSGTFTVTPKSDTFYDSGETFKVELYLTPERDVLKATTDSIIINNKTIGFIATTSDSFGYTYSGNVRATSPSLISANITQPQFKYSWNVNGVLQNTTKAMASEKIAGSSWRYNSIGVPALVATTKTSSLTDKNGTNVTTWNTDNSRNQQVYGFELLNFNNKISTSGNFIQVPNKSYNAFLVPEDGTYNIKGTIPFRFTGNDTLAGPSVFKIIGIVEKTLDPGNESSWTYVTHTTLNPQFSLSNFENAFIKHNTSQSIIWFDSLPNIGNPKTNYEMAFRDAYYNLILDDSQSLTANYWVRFKLYWIDLSSAYYTIAENYLAANYVRWSVGTQSTFEIVKT